MSLDIEREFKKIYNEMMEEKLQEANQRFFVQRSLRLEVLKDCPYVIPTLAEWLYEEWRLYDVSLTKEKLIKAFKGRLNKDQIPITFVALKGDHPVGVISLKKEKDDAFSDFPENAIWMGSLQVVPEERKKGLGQELLKFSQTIARGFGYDKLYFYTSNPKNVPWYLNRGAELIDERIFRKHPITVMELAL